MKYPVKRSEGQNAHWGKYRKPSTDAFKLQTFKVRMGVPAFAPWPRARRPHAPGGHANALSCSVERRLGHVNRV